MINLNHKKILVLGASGFIGEQVAIKLSTLGARVILSGRNKEKLKSTFFKLKGNNHSICPFDINEKNQIKDFLKSIVELDNKKISGFVYCNGMANLRPLKNTNLDFSNTLMDMNYYSFIEIVRLFSDKRISEEASIVSISSIASINGDKGQLAYSASKGALDSSIKVIAKELYTKEIRINNIRPAALLPEDIEFDTLPDAIKKTIIDMKTGPISPESIADQTCFLLSDFSKGITGKSFDVRGYLI